MHGGVPQKRGLSLVHVRTENRMALPCCARQKRLTGKKNSVTVRFPGKWRTAPMVRARAKPCPPYPLHPKSNTQKRNARRKTRPAFPAGGWGVRIGHSLSAEKKRRRRQAVSDKSGMKRICEAYRRAETKQQDTPPKRKRGRPLADVWAVCFCLFERAQRQWGTAYSQGSLLSS